MRAKMASLGLTLSFLAVLFVSGCTSTTTGGTGVVVKEFAPEFTEIYATEPVTFRMLVKNEGSVEATSVHAELLGLDEDWCSSQTGTQTCTPSSGTQRMEMQPNENACRYPGDGFKLLAPDAQRGTSGGSQICTWTYKAPPIPQGFTITYTPIVRTFYSYKSGVAKLITFGSSSELRTIQDSGGTLPTESVSSTSSPIKLDIVTKGPIRFWSDEQKVIFPLEITITNVGGGVACAYPDINKIPSQYTTDTASNKGACKVLSGEEAKNKVDIDISFGSQIGKVNSGSMKLTGGCEDYNGGIITVPLWKGQSNSIVCDVEVQASDLGSGATIQRMITVQASYEYYTDTSSSIKVIGRKTAS